MPPIRQLVRALRFALLPVLFLGLAPGAGAHEIPTTVTVQTIVRPDGDVLRVLVRVPLNSMRDFAWPLRGPGYLVIQEMETQLREAAQLWIVDYLRIHEDGRLLTQVSVEGVRISLPSDQSFRSYEDALANILGPPLPDETELFWEQALFDVLLEYPIASDESRFSVDSELAHLGIFTTTILRFQLPGSPERLFQFSGVPGLIELDPRWYQAALRFVSLGFQHILEGFDHLLFVFCLVIPFRRFLPLVAVVTAFTIAHSITLIASALGYAPNTLWFPAFIEMMIALSIVYMAFENIIGANLRRRWVVAFAFGLVHGFGFAFLLRESLQFAGGHLTASLLAFNVGVELGQILVLILAIPVLELLFRHVVQERMGVILLSALIAHTAWHWMDNRWQELRQYPIDWPVMDAAFLASAMRWTMAILILAGIVWAALEVMNRIERLRGEVAPKG